MSKENITNQNSGRSAGIYATEQQRILARKLEAALALSAGVATLFGMSEVHSAKAAELVANNDPVSMHTVSDHVLGPGINPASAKIDGSNTGWSSGLENPDDDPALLYCAPLAIGAGVILLFALGGNKSGKRAEDQMQGRDQYIRNRVEQIRAEEVEKKAKQKAAEAEKMRRQEVNSQHETERLRKEAARRAQMEQEQRRREAEAMAELEFLFEMLHYVRFSEGVNQQPAHEGNTQRSRPIGQRPRQQKTQNPREKQQPRQENRQEANQQYFDTRAFYLKELGLPPNASSKDIRAAFRKLAKENHPDTNPGLSGEKRAGKEEKFRRVAEAYAKLGKPR